jgi:hypothetical protein
LVGCSLELRWSSLCPGFFYNTALLVWKINLLVLNELVPAFEPRCTYGTPKTKKNVVIFLGAIAGASTEGQPGIEPRAHRKVVQ